MQAGETLNRASNKPMFVSYAGNDMTASNAAQSVRKTLSRSGVLETLKRKDPKFTMVRKLITTLVRDEEPELAGPEALGHTEGTGANLYQLKQSQKRSAIVIKKIQTTISTAAAKEKGLTGATTSSEEEGPINAESFTTTEVEEEGLISAESVTPLWLKRKG